MAVGELRRADHQIEDLAGKAGARLLDRGTDRHGHVAILAQLAEHGPQGRRGIDPQELEILLALINQLNPLDQNA
jgi:hypothetical protein